MISKETFVNAMNNIKKQQKRVENLSTALEDMSDGYVVFDTNNLYLESLLEVINESLGIDTSDYQKDIIGWWLWENVDKYTYDSVTHEIIDDLTTPELLYDYIIKNQQCFQSV